MKIQKHTELEVYKKAFDVAMPIFEVSKKFPKEKTYSLTDQVRRSSRSVCANLAEAWRKRRYEGAFIEKSFLIRKAKPLRRKCGSSSPFDVAISKERSRPRSIRPTMKF